MARAALETYLRGKEPAPSSFLEAIQAAAGWVEGPGDLSTNAKHMEGFGA